MNWLCTGAAVDTEELPAGVHAELGRSCPHSTHFLPVTFSSKGATSAHFVL